MKKIIIAMILLLAAVLLMTCAAGEAGKPTGTRLPIIEQESVTRDCFFANGTQIFIESPKADVTGWIHDTEVQEGLGNGFSPSKKPGQGAVISWMDDADIRYVYVSNNSKVFGGSLNADVEADVEIDVRGTDARKDFPNVSFLFGGGYGGNVIGDVTITLEASQMMYVYGGGYNGSVTGDVLIQSTGDNWSLDMVGGGLASSKTGDAVADVGGNVTLYAEGRNVYQVCGGGEAYRTNENCGYPTANVGGSVSVELVESRVRYYAEGRTTLLGGVFAGGLGYYGTANVAGSVMAVVTDTIFDENAIGVVLGGMAEGEGAVANVGGDAYGRADGDSNPANIVRGCITHTDGSGEVIGDISWYYTPRDGMTDY